MLDPFSAQITIDTNRTIGEISPLLFGGFAERVFAAYDEAFPLAPGASERVALYQLYPLMVHVNLFGGGYGASVERALARYA